MNHPASTTVDEVIIMLGVVFAVIDTEVNYVFHSMKCSCFLPCRCHVLLCYRCTAEACRKKYFIISDIYCSDSPSISQPEKKIRAGSIGLVSVPCRHLRRHATLKA